MYGSDSDDFDFNHSADESVEDDPSVSGSNASASNFDDDEDFDGDDENAHPNAKKAKTNSSGKKSAAAAATTSSKQKKKTIEETYQKKTQLEHILLRPDTYIGSVEPLAQQPMFVLDSETERIHQRDITYTPGFYKIFDEIVVNAADNKQRDAGMDRMEVDVDAERGVISVMNNGKGIPIAKHKEHDCYVATLIFGHLLTGSNFDDNEKKTTGGRNGYGAKLANIFSKKFAVECVDAKKGLKFTQVWRDNMHKAEEPIVEKCSSSEKKGGDYVRITFKPDFERFNMNGLDDDAVGLISKRAYDIAGSMANKEGKKLRVYLNGEKLKCKDFKSYLALFDGISAPVVYEKVGDDWEVGVGSVLDGGGFQQISFVNAIATTKGGGHVDYITNTLVTSLKAAVKKKNKGGKDVKPAQVKNHLSVFINCLVSNPTFDSQTKENLTTKANTFKKSVKLSDQFMKKVEKCGVVESIMQFAKFQEGRALQRKGGTKKNKLKGITKLDDANFAGMSKSKDCTLIITEGDSAKSLAVSGLSVVGRDYYGVFPLKGKPLNVRDATHAQIMKNEEIMNLVEIMGLKFNVTYTEENIKTLRYGHLMIMADQDHDGSHIKGLVINLFHHFWPSLLDVPGFLQQFITPIVKCTKGKNSETFYTLPQFEEWKESTENDAKGWKIKYYKGLGTSTSSEAKYYFSNLEIHEIHFNELSTDVICRSDSDDEMDVDDEGDKVVSTGASLIDMAFNKKKADERKEWLGQVQKNTFLNYSDAQNNGVNYSDFVNKELALFSQYDVHRSLPHLLDGLKPSQRKVLYACFKKKLKNEIKVAQLAGYIGEHSAYHHGEASLHGTIVNMAQNYCGSNNVNLLYPSGQFGTRRMGGKDHASARYIFTRLESITRAIYHPDDDDLMEYLNDDGLSIEPEYYMPVIPMILVNGSDGIGTGWSSTIHNHDPREIISNIRKLINKEEPDEMHPEWCGWTGEIIAETGKREGCYIVRGKIKRINNTTLVISELPIGRWTQDYKKVLENMMAGAENKTDEKTGNEKSVGDITDFREKHTDNNVSFVISAKKEKIDAFEKVKGSLYGKFKLETTISTRNMTAFDQDGKIRQYATSGVILQEFFRQRMVFYIARKDMLLHKMRKDLSILENKARFVEEVCEGNLIVSNRKRPELLTDLKEKGYDLFPKDEKNDIDEDAEDGDSVEESPSDAELSKGYEYLLGMKIWSLTFERAEELRRQRKDKNDEVDTLEATSPEQVWLNDLDAIEDLLNERDEALGVEAKNQKNAQGRRRLKKPAKKSNKKKTKDVWDSEMEDEDSESGESDSDSDCEDDFVMVKTKSKPKPAPKKAPVKSKKPAKIAKNKDEWDSEMEELESDANSGSEESDTVEVESDSEDDFIVAEPAPKESKLIKRQSGLKDFFGNNKPAPNGSAPMYNKSAPKPKSTVPKKAAPKKAPGKTKKPVALASKKVAKRILNKGEWDSEMGESESDANSGSEESDNVEVESDSEDDFIGAEPVPKSESAKPKRQSVLKDPAPKPKLLKLNAKSARSGGKVGRVQGKVSIEILSKFLSKTKKKPSCSSNKRDIDENNDEELDDFMIDSDESPVKKAVVKKRGVYGGPRSKAARAAQKRDKGGSSDEGASPSKKKRMDDDHKCNVDDISCSESDGQSDGDSEDDF